MESILLDVSGVGYEVSCPLTVLDQLPPAGGTAVVCIHTHVREDQITLFGFANLDERRLFRQLISISGVGPKIGLACLSGLNASTLIAAIGGGDVKTLTTVPGLGKRTSERIILELREKVGGLAVAARQPNRILDDLESALKNLGYKAKEVDQLCSDLASDSKDASFEGLLKEALKRLRSK
ncbi:MAG: Holliday junction branch migration protein RuvA [Myxococcota bacterium]|nr:Holliday junction branch migration protein RuvA [Myxococcota bacterium]